MTARMKLSHFCKLAMSLLIIAALHTPLSAADKEYIEVEIDGETVGKWLELASIDEYDSTGNKVRTKIYGDYSYYEFCYEYNAKGQQTHYIYSKGSQQTGESYKNETWYTYDQKGHNIYSKNSDGEEIWYNYNSKGNKIHAKNSDGKEAWYEYDRNGNEIHTKDSDGNETWSDYTGKGRLVHYKDSNGYEYWNDYDRKGNKIHTKSSAGDEEWYEYNSKGEMIHCKKSSGFEYWYEFDNNGRRIYSKDSDGVEEWNAYDQYGNPVRTIVKRNGKLDNVHVHILEYYKNSETLKKDTCYSFSG